MCKVIFYVPGTGAASRAACRILGQKFHIAEKPEPDVTHLLLPVPSFEADGRIKGGGVLENILGDLPEDITVIGGNLNHPLLNGYKCIDLLRDEEYTAKNAAITADCAIRVAGANLPVVFEKCPILIVGWGRIGKCLAAKLKALGADVTVTSRKHEDRCMLRALGYGAEDPGAIADLSRFRVIFNTAPTPVLSCTPRDTLKIDLASKPGILGSDVIRAGGLPGKMVPESSGALIARSVIRIFDEMEVRK